MIYIDEDEHVAVVAQCFFAKVQKPSAPANKASDLNTAVGWLLQRPMDKVPERIKSSVQKLRDAIKAGAISEINFWYSHNLPESKNVGDELSVVATSAATALKALYPEVDVRVSAMEIGSETLSLWYADSLSPILVDETFLITDRNSVV